MFIHASTIVSGMSSDLLLTTHQLKTVPLYVVDRPPGAVESIRERCNIAHGAAVWIRYVNGTLNGRSSDKVDVPSSSQALLRNVLVGS